MDRPGGNLLVGSVRCVGIAHSIPLRLLRPRRSGDRLRKSGRPRSRLLTRLVRQRGLNTALLETAVLALGGWHRGVRYGLVGPRRQDVTVPKERVRLAPPSASNRIGALFSYVVETDSGFAPNPFFGSCTLACCKPKIRRAVGERLLRRSGRVDIRELRSAEPGFIRDQNMWVVGLAGASLRDRPRRSVVYAMQVTDVLDFESYFEEYPQKRPVRTAMATPADPTWHGDAIYTGNDPATARQLAPCTHSDGDREDEGNKHHDLDGRYVLVSDHFVYFGKDAPYVLVEEHLHHGRGHSSNHAPEAVMELESLLNGPWADLFNDQSDHRSVEVAARSSRACRGGR